LPTLTLPNFSFADQSPLEHRFQNEQTHILILILDKDKHTHTHKDEEEEEEEEEDLSY
jgi:hypothetical protein